ncbi:CDP-alcohol phosphatidyltransferase family protein [Salinimicrobium sediminilitoris]|uniref:CDP-alcohol phosphatidyltransferase family protein n=1 Tax=Salinimicrobium sediminilitoris TaxID=2876715 RepID=UPI001E4AB4A0|nr:CDP-alcohol phosphatidyltransferase family protein [Salinimicrobium sediminilitoris]MCC8358553.1 CDP-alcohol phosphatidyltransferase family protein [Salinimicrobium sediminilitoris]
MSLAKHVPNAITLINLLSGSIGAIFAVQGDLVMAAIFVALGIFFDFFDGLAARALNVKSELGLQLDSLADMVTSGLVPGIVMYQLFRQALPGSAVQPKDWTTGQDVLEWNLPVLALFGLLVTLASGYRLAKFNIDERQTDSFIGLPTPANALLILSLPLILIFQPQPILVDIILNPWFLAALTVFSCFMLNAEIPLFALKFSSWGFSENKVRYLFLIFCVILLIFLQFAAIPLIIISYVIVSMVTNRGDEEAVVESR